MMITCNLRPERKVEKETIAAKYCNFQIALLVQFLRRSILIVEVFNIEVFLKMCECVLLDMFKDSSYQHLLGTVQGRDRTASYVLSQICISVVLGQ